MSKVIYEVRSCVCDYGIYKEGKLVSGDLIFSSRKNAEYVCSIMNADINKEQLIKREVKYPGFYRHFKYDPNKIPNNYIYCTMFKSKPTGIENIANASKTIRVFNTELEVRMHLYLIDNEWYHSNKEYDKELVIYESIYDDCIPYARETSEFLSRVPEGREEENITGQVYRFEEV